MNPLPYLPLDGVVLAYLGEGPDFLERLLVWPIETPLGDTWLVLSLLVGICGFAVWQFWHLRSLSVRAKAGILGLCVAAAILAGGALGRDVGLYVALGLTAQVAGGLAWSERCYALLGGRRWQRVTTAIAGCLTPMLLGVWPMAIREVLLLAVQHAQLTNRLIVMLYLVAIGPWVAIATLIIGFAAIQHLRAFYRAQEWNLARSTLEPPEKLTDPDGDDRDRKDDQD